MKVILAKISAGREKFLYFQVSKFGPSILLAQYPVQIGFVSRKLSNRRNFCQMPFQQSRKNLDLTTITHCTVLHYMLYVTHHLDPMSDTKGLVGTPAHYKTVIVNGLEVKLKFCVACDLFHPPQATQQGYVTIVQVSWSRVQHTDLVI